VPSRAVLRASTGLYLKLHYTPQMMMMMIIKKQIAGIN